MDFLCPICGELMRDPVLADDGRHYERRCIEEWFQACKDRELSITSPWTSDLMTENIRENPDFKTKIALAVQERSLKTGLENVPSIRELNAIFATLDPLRDILERTLKKWNPPQLVVIGDESSGKSSLLQRLVMMPILPTAKNTCTRLPIHVRLRNAEQAKAPRLEVYCSESKRTVEGPFVVPMQTARDFVHKKMNEILTSEQGKSKGISSQHKIILHVEGPNIPSLDVVDMPGLVATPKLMKKQSEALLKNHIKTHGESCIYLAVVSADGRQTNSIAMGLVQEQNIESKTLGVFCKCDNLNQERLAEKGRLMREPSDAELEEHGGLQLSPHGWYATMNAPLQPLEGESSSALLLRQADAEVDFFRREMPRELLDDGRASGAALIKGLSSMFLQHVQSTWASTTFRLLKKAVEAARMDDMALGMPVLSGQSPEEVNLARSLSRSEAEKMITDGFSAAEQRCYKQVLHPLKGLLAQLDNEKSISIDAVIDHLKQDMLKMQEQCRTTVEEWEIWWKKAAPDLIGDAATEKSVFVLGRFPKYIAAVLRRIDMITIAAKNMVQAAIMSGLEQFYSEWSPTSKFSTEIKGVRANIRVSRDAAQLTERMIISFLRGSQMIRDGLMKAAADSADEVQDWAESCSEQRARLAERIKQVESAKEKISKALGVDELLVEHNPARTKQIVIDSNSDNELPERYSSKQMETVKEMLDEDLGEEPEGVSILGSCIGFHYDTVPASPFCEI